MAQTGKVTWVPRKKVKVPVWHDLLHGSWTPTRTPGSSSVRVMRTKWQPGHYATKGGRWVSKPGSKPGTIDGKIPIPDAPNAPPLTDPYAGIEDRAHAWAAAQLADKRAAIERARNAAAQQAARDAATYQALGGAQMQMIGQIPQHIQEIRNAAGQAMAQFGNQVSAGNAAQLQAEQAAASSFAAGQGIDASGTAPAAAVPSATPPADAAGTPGLNAQAAMAASAQLGGVLPARNQAEIGAASAMAAEGMPAVVARATQDQVAMRMAQASTEDADYRQQLIDLASTEGGVYMDALSSLYDIEEKKLGAAQAKKNEELDWKKYEESVREFNEQQKQWQKEFNLKTWAAKQSAIAAGTTAKTKAQQQKFENWKARQQLKQGWARVGQGKQRIRLANEKAARDAQKAVKEGQRIDAAASNAEGWLRNKNGDYILNDQGQRIKTWKAAHPSSGTKRKGEGVKTANSMASQMRGSADQYDSKTGKWKYNQPKVGYASAISQITAAIHGRGYPMPEARAIAVNAVNAHYGPRFRPKKKKK